MGPRFESVKVHQWPVGQVVKTEASHAFNIGSNPVRVTSSSCETQCWEMRKHISSPVFQFKPALLGFESVGENERKDKAVRTQKSFNI